jgi:membrane protein YqaA with SNARE-associated domain
MLDEQIAGHPEVASAWYGKFGPWMVVLGLLSNVFEVVTSAGGAVEFGLTSMNHTNPFASVQDAHCL